jgi:DNA-binding NtrC family response regulator
MGQTLESWGHEVIKAPDGSKAVEAIKKEKLDVAVLDYIMPDLDGIALLGKIRDVDKDIPVIMFTANPDTDAIKESAHLNITAFVPKLSPYVDTQASLRSALNMALRKPKK